jgi:hypothetical protein
MDKDTGGNEYACQKGGPNKGREENCDKAYYRYVSDEKIEFLRSHRLNQCLSSLSVLPPIFCSNLASSSTKSSSSDQS